MGLKFLGAADKFALAVCNIVKFKFIVPVHGHVHKGFWQTALIVAVGNIGSAVLSFFFGVFSWKHVRGTPFYVYDLMGLTGLLYDKFDKYNSIIVS